VREPNHTSEVICQSYWELIPAACFFAAAFLSGGRQDTVFVDIESKMEFFFYGVFASSSCFRLEPRTLSGLVRLCSLNRSSPRKI
jgi:hypothetical protein